MRRRFFEVKREMRDGGNIHLDDANKENNYMTPDLEEVLNQVGFDDYEEDIEQENREISLDENGCPVLPEGWTFLTHGSSLDRWDTSQLGSDFVVGEAVVNGQKMFRRPLCCVERHMAQYDYNISGANTAESYGGKHQAFQIRVLYYSNPRTSDGKVVREKLSPEQISEINKCYMYQDGRHPAIPAGTKLSFLTNGDFDEITNTNGNNILWYIPEQYLEAYLEDTKQMENVNTKDKNFVEDMSVISSSKVQPSNVQTQTTLTNDDVIKELKEFYTEDISISAIEAYLLPKIQAIYGDRLYNAGITDVRKFLSGKLENFEGASSYIELVEEIDGLLEDSKEYRKALDELNINNVKEEKGELSPLLKEITRCNTWEEKNEKAKAAKVEYDRQESAPGVVVKDKGINIGGRG